MQWCKSLVASAHHAIIIVFVVVTYRFDYGVLVCWGLNEKQEGQVLKLLAPSKV